ncbi:MAG TPA: hypothetical protein VMQ51_13545 [Candidatus Binatia bacterium]|nr:hypothetical protein [Candidatus Binatia bacterium]
MGRGGDPPRDRPDAHRALRNQENMRFGVAVFDNAQVRHAYTPGVLKLTFE